MPESWIKTNTFHHSEFKDIERLVKAKRRKGLSISLCLPTLNEEKTVAKEIVVMKSELMTRFPLLDEIVVIDSGSTDNTRSIARSYDVEVVQADHVLPELASYRGKGENLWKALYVARGDIIIYIDADIKNIHHRFAYGLLGPLLLSDHIRFTKAFYDRPIAVEKNSWRPSGGGRVTELVIRPLFALFLPELTQIMQPLSGEYAGFRSVFETIPFHIGYGVETGMLIDIYEKYGLDVIAQVDLDRRVHRNQDTQALGRMAFIIMKTFLGRVEKQGRLKLRQALYEEMIQYRRKEGCLRVQNFHLEQYERPPMVELAQYRARIGRKKLPAPTESGFALDRTCAT